jgi:hypothetical protein
MRVEERLTVRPATAEPGETVLVTRVSTVTQPQGWGLSCIPFEADPPPGLKDGEEWRQWTALFYGATEAEGQQVRLYLPSTSVPPASSGRTVASRLVEHHESIDFASGNPCETKSVVVDTAEITVDRFMAGEYKVSLGTPGVVSLTTAHRGDVPLTEVDYSISGELPVLNVYERIAPVAGDSGGADGFDFGKMFAEAGKQAAFGLVAGAIGGCALATAPSLGLACVPAALQGAIAGAVAGAITGAATSAVDQLF